MLCRTPGRNESPLESGITLECGCDSSTQDSHKTRAAGGKTTQELERLISRSCCWGGKGSSRIRGQPPLQTAQQTKSRNKQTNREGLATSCWNGKEVKGGRSPSALQKHSRLRGASTALPPPNCSHRAPKETLQQLTLQPRFVILK